MRSRALPCSTGNNAMNALRRHTVTLGNLRQCLSVRFAANLWNVTCCQLGVWVVRSARSWTTSLRNHVSHVVGVGADSQMVRVYADSVVALVKYVHLSWNRNATMNLYRQTVGLFVLVIHHQATIASARLTTPRPTLIAASALYSEPKASSHRHGTATARIARLAWFPLMHVEGF